MDITIWLIILVFLLDFPVIWNIIQTKYPEVPSIRIYVDKTDNEDDELLAINEYQKKVWFQMNNEQRKQEHEK